VRDDRRLPIAGQLAILASLLMVVGLFPDYQGGEPFSVKEPDLLWFVLAVAALALTAGVLVLRARTRGLLGPGLLLGVAATSTTGLLVLLGAPLLEDGFQSGLGLEIAGFLSLVLAAILAGLAVARVGEVRLVRLPAVRSLPWLVVFLGAAGAVLLGLLALGILSLTHDWTVAPLVWAGLLALAVPALAAATVPRRFTASVLAGWAAGGVALCIALLLLLDRRSRETGADLGSELALTAMAGLTMLALLVVAAVVARAGSVSEAERRT